MELNLHKIISYIDISTKNSYQTELFGIWKSQIRHSLSLHLQNMLEYQFRQSTMEKLISKIWVLIFFNLFKYFFKFCTNKIIFLLDWVGYKFERINFNWSLQMMKEEILFRTYIETYWLFIQIIFFSYHIDNVSTKYGTKKLSFERKLRFLWNFGGNVEVGNGGNFEHWI